MQQRQPRLGDILDDYCPRERRLTNHVVVAMIGEAVKQTRCTTCESDHEYKHAALPRQKKKSEHSALFSQVLANVSPKKVAPMSVLPDEAVVAVQDVPVPHVVVPAAPQPVAARAVSAAGAADAFDALFDLPDDVDGNREAPAEEGPFHRRLIRAQLPKHEGQQATARQAPDFTIRQPNPGRPKRFGARPARNASSFQGGRPGGGAGNGNNHGNGNSVRGGGGQRQGGRPQGGRPQGGGGSRPANRQGGGGRNRSK